MKYLLIILALAGGFFYASRHCKLDDGLEYVKQHKGASWAFRANYAIAWIYHQREEYPKSQAAFQQLLADYPACPYAASSLVYLAEAAQNNGDWAAAKEALARYSDEHPEGPQIGLVRKRQELLRYHHGP